jgi:hypothetical protein
MKQITPTPERSWRDALNAARAEIRDAGGVVLVAKTPRARRHLEKIDREFNFPRRHKPESPPETWPRRGDEISPRKFVSETGDWHLLLSFPDRHPQLDHRGLPVTD